MKKEKECSKGMMKDKKMPHGKEKMMHKEMKKPEKKK